MDMAVLGRLFLFHQQISLNVADFFRRLVTLQYASVARDKEFSEVPFDIGLLVVIGILLTHHLVHKLALLVARVKTAKALLCFQEGVERMLVGSIHLNLVELRELEPGACSPNWLQGKSRISKPSLAYFSYSASSSLY